MSKALVAALQLTLLLLLPATEVKAFFGRVDFTVEDDFSEASILRGIKANQEQCKSAGNAAIWASVNRDLEECIKYWGSGLTNATGRVIVYMHGDRLPTPPSYLKLTGQQLSNSAATWGNRLKAPYIYIGRPGTHGSSGDHRKRRTIEEGLILSKAFDALSERYGIKEFVVAGQSGGGHATSSLLTLRNDIVCAIPTSAPSSPSIRFRKMGRTTDTTNHVSYEPTEHLQSNAMHKKLRVFILGDPNDSNVFWESQTILAEPLKKRGIEHAIIEGVATGARKHSLDNSARFLAGLCYHDKETSEIVEHLKKKNIKG